MSKPISLFHFHVLSENSIHGNDNKKQKKNVVEESKHQNIHELTHQFNRLIQVEIWNVWEIKQFVESSFDKQQFFWFHAHINRFLNF